ncbi:OmpA family protein [Prevotella sp. E9-3]|uniref:OmpA family protein n=1 Tax=Prevotella sp. E9-3 TaxID=2913621 RepID=UPI001EDBC853|nr:OmpA family protein [Prevotella sp. E9-3]UKK47790.1 OmpA family protein [Prevotella sp. E9-3]
MKKLFMVLALASVSVAGMAQNETPEMKYSVATNSFWSNWFISADVMYGAFYSNEEKGNDFKKSPFTDYRRNLGASVAVGKWFTPGLGLRTKFQGIWGRHVLTDNADDNAIKFWNLQEQVLFNLSNLFCGYNENRVWNLIPYVGVGVLRNCSDNEYAHGGSIGLLNTWKLSKHVALNLDLGFNVSDDDYANASAGHAGYGHSIAQTDRYFAAEVGLTFNLGKATWNKTPDVDALKALSQSQIDALNAQLADAQAENDRLQNMINNHKCPEAQTVTVKEVTAAPVSVFFNINKSKIASRKDLQNVQELANVAKEKNAKLVVTGYADSKTGSAAYNQKLSQKRAETVANELVKMGVSRDNIEVVAAGGVQTLSPISYNRRATVAIK